MTALARWPNVPRTAVAAAGRCGLPDTWPESRGTGVMPARSQARSRTTIVADRFGLLSPTALAPFLTPSPVVADLRHRRIVWPVHTKEIWDDVDVPERRRHAGRHCPRAHRRFRVCRRSRGPAPYRFLAFGEEFPGLLPVDRGGAPIAGELYDVPLNKLQQLLRAEPPQLELSIVTLSDGQLSLGMVVRAGQEINSAITDITEAGSWRRHLSTRA